MEDLLKTLNALLPDALAVAKHFVEVYRAKEGRLADLQRKKDAKEAEAAANPPKPKRDLRVIKEMEW